MHLGAYFVLALLLMFAGKPCGKKYAWIWAAIASLYGFTDEAHQAFVPGRSPELLDVFADVLGAFFALMWWKHGPRPRD